MKRQFRLGLLITFLCLIPFIEGCGKTTSQTTAPISVAEAEADYVQNCAICHQSPPQTRNLQQIIKVTNNGKGRMPAYKGILSEGQIEAIANYIVSD